MPQTPIATHVGVLASMQYVVKTAFGVLETYIQSVPRSFLFGTVKAVELHPQSG